MSDTKKAVVLLSGGLDSTTTLAITKAEGFQPWALSFRYGQRHSYELEAATRIAQTIGVAQHITVQIDLRLIGGSALTGPIDVPKGRKTHEMSSGIPVTYVPARNTIFLSFAIAWAEVLEAFDIFIGVNALDYSGYPDCRPEYIDAFEKMANLATRAGVEGRTRLKVHTPLIKLSKAEIIRRGIQLGVDGGGPVGLALAQAYLLEITQQFHRFYQKSCNYRFLKSGGNKFHRPHPVMCDNFYF